MITATHSRLVRSLCLDARGCPAGEASTTPGRCCSSRPAASPGPGLGGSWDPARHRGRRAERGQGAGVAFSCLMLFPCPGNLPHVPGQEQLRCLAAASGSSSQKLPDPRALRHLKKGVPACPLLHTHNIFILLKNSEKNKIIYFPNCFCQGHCFTGSEEQGFASSPGFCHVSLAAPCPAPTQPLSAPPAQGLKAGALLGSGCHLQMKRVKSGSQSPQLRPFKITGPLGAVGVQSKPRDGMLLLVLGRPGPTFDSHCHDPRLGSGRGGDSVTQQFQTQEHLLRHRIINDFLVHPPSRKARARISNVLKALPLSSVWLPLIAALTGAAAR